MKDEKFNQKFKEYKEFNAIVGKAIGYSEEIECEVTDCYIEAKWEVSDDNLMVISDGNEYGFTVSSYSAKGEKLFMGEINELTLIMVYSDNWELSFVYIFKTANKIVD